MTSKHKLYSRLLKKVALVGIFSVSVLGCGRCTMNNAQPLEVVQAEPVVKPKHVRGIHITPWVVGTPKFRKKIDALLDETELNTVVIAVKEVQGEVYIPGVPLAEKHKLFVNAVPDFKEYIAGLKARGIYTIARVVVFKDKAMAQKKPEWAVKTPSGDIWKDYRGNSWLDPYNQQAWDYNLTVATQAVALGFEEIQFDYIRFPSDGDMKETRYSNTKHSPSSATLALDGFLEEAAKRLKPLGVNISIDVFGLTPSVPHGMGIGQQFVPMTRWVDFISPMVYPSHYAKGEYGIPNPNVEPYRVVFRTVSDGVRKLGDLNARPRPYLQDFSLGHKYGPVEVRAQIQACEDAGVYEWLLWDPNCRYTRAALKSKAGVLSDEAKVPERMIGKQTEKFPGLKKSTDAVAALAVRESTKPASVATSTGAKVLNADIKKSTKPVSKPKKMKAEKSKQEIAESTGNAKETGPRKLKLKFWKSDKP